MQSTIFTERYLPTKPLASDNIKQGVRRFSKLQALEKTFIETQPKTLKNFMVFDIDIDEANLMVKSLAWDDGSIPEPNIITTNVHSGHAHVVYFLDGVVTSPRADSYYNSVRNRLQVKLSGDTAYGSRIMRNPLTHSTEYITDVEYKLSDIELFVPDHLPFIQKTEQAECAGRNDALFMNLRKFSYSAYRKCGYDYHKLYSILETQAYFLNHSSFDTPLSDKEVTSIVKSIYKWTMTNHSAAAFSKIQSSRSTKRWGNFKEERDAQVLEMKEVKKMTYVEIGQELAITPTAAKTAYYRAKSRN